MTSEERPEIIRWLEDIRKCADKNHEIKSELAARYVNDERDRRIACATQMR